MFSFGLASYDPPHGFSFAIGDVGYCAEFHLAAVGKVANLDGLLHNFGGAQLSYRNVTVMFSEGQEQDVLPMCCSHQFNAFKMLDKSQTWTHSGVKRYWSPGEPIFEVLDDADQQSADSLDDGLLHEVSLPGAQALLEYWRTLASRWTLQNLDAGELLMSGFAIAADIADMIGMPEPA